MPVSGAVEPLEVEGGEVLPRATDVLLREEVQRGRIDSQQRQELSEALCHMLMSLVKQFAEVVSSIDGVDIGKSK